MGGLSACREIIQQYVFKNPDRGFSTQIFLWEIRMCKWNINDLS